MVDDPADPGFAVPLSDREVRSRLWEVLGPNWKNRAGWDPALVGDRLALRLSFSRDRIALPLARAARSFVQSKGWLAFGYARIEDHARERFGRCGRWVRDLAALAEATERLPGLSEAMTGDDGGRPIGRVVALLIGRTAAPGTCRDWVALARTLPVRELRKEIQKARQAGTSAPSGALPAGHEAAVGDDANHMGPAPQEDPEIEERCTIRLALPPPVLAALDEARDLHSAISGGQASLTSFIEALVAEAFAGPVSPLQDTDGRGVRLDQASREGILAQASENWAFLHRFSDAREVLAEAEGTLREVERLCRAAAGDADGSDGLIRALTHLEDEIDCRLGEVLALMGASGAWRGLCFAGVGHYAEERLGMSRTTAEDRARLARSLRGLPTVREAHEQGRIGSQAAALIHRLLAGVSHHLRLEAAWVAHAERTTVKRLRDELGLWVRETAVSSTREAAAPMDDATWHASLSRRSGQAIERVARYGRKVLEAFPALVVVPMRLPNDLAAHLLAALSARRQSLHDLVKRVPREEPWPDPDSSPSVLAARTFSIRLGVVPEWVAMLAMVEDFVATWDDPRQNPKREADEIYIRDGWRCSAPGCTSRQNLEDHHVVYRSRRGTDELSNRTCLCRFHHQQGEHGELLTCRGEAPLGLVWRLGRDGIGGAYRNERTL